MTGNELIKQLNEQRKDDHKFVKWWRKENDFVDIELFDTFFASVKASDQFEGFELLDMNQLWEIVKRLCADRVTRAVHGTEEMITWERPDDQGAVRKISCSFAPEFLMQIFDVETKGNYIEAA